MWIKSYFLLWIVGQFPFRRNKFLYLFHSWTQHIVSVSFGVIFITILSTFSRECHFSNKFYFTTLCSEEVCNLWLGCKNLQCFSGIVNRCDIFGVTYVKLGWLVETRRVSRKINECLINKTEFKESPLVLQFVFFHYLLQILAIKRVCLNEKFCFQLYHLKF